MVHNDPHADPARDHGHKGSGRGQPNGELLHLADYQRASFQEDSPRMAKTQEIGPPTQLLRRTWMADFQLGRIEDGGVCLTPMPNAAGYRFVFRGTRISRPL